jgi:hypothetical protein
MEREEKICDSYLNYAASQQGMHLRDGFMECNIS